MRSHRSAVSIVVVLIAFVISQGFASPQTPDKTAASAPTSSAKRPITEKDLFRFTWIANPQLAPDGSRVAFTRVLVDEKRTGYETSIWTVATSGSDSPIRLTNGKHDGKRLAFIRGGEKDDTGKPKPAQIAILSLGGGEGRIVTDLPKGAANPVWS